jgi:hypothetical protein
MDKRNSKTYGSLEWRRNRNFEGSKSYRKTEVRGSSGGNPDSTARKSASKQRWVAAMADVAPWPMPCVSTSWIHADRAWMHSRKFGPAGSTNVAFSYFMMAERARMKKTLPINKMRGHIKQEDMVMTIPYRLRLCLTHCGFSHDCLPIGCGKCRLHSGEARP